MKQRHCVGPALDRSPLLAAAWAKAGRERLQVRTFAPVQPQQFVMLRRQANAFAAVKVPEGFKIRAGKRHPAGFKIRYRGGVVLIAEHAPPWLRIGVPAGLEALPPEILQLRDWFQMWLEGVGVAVVEGDRSSMFGAGPARSSRP